MVFTITLIAALGIQYALYRTISRKLAVRAAYKRRLQSLVTEMPKARVNTFFSHNRPGEN